MFFVKEAAATSRSPRKQNQDHKNHGKRTEAVYRRKKTASLSRAVKIRGLSRKKKLRGAASATRPGDVSTS
jgi:hypothetical protein